MFVLCLVIEPFHSFRSFHKKLLVCTILVHTYLCIRFAWDGWKEAAFTYIPQIFVSIFFLIFFQFICLIATLCGL